MKRKYSSEEKEKHIAQWRVREQSSLWACKKALH